MWIYGRAIILLIRATVEKYVKSMFNNPTENILVIIYDICAWLVRVYLHQIYQGLD